MTTGEMAKAPALFLRNATGLVKGWSGFDAFAYAFMSVNLVTPRHVLQPRDLRLRARRVGDRVDPHHRGRHDVHGIAYAGLIAVDAPSGRRLRLADARPRRHPGRGRRWRLRSIAVFLVGTALASTAR